MLGRVLHHRGLLRLWIMLGREQTWGLPLVGLVPLIGRRLWGPLRSCGDSTYACGAHQLRAESDGHGVHHLFAALLSTLHHQ